MKKPSLSARIRATLHNYRRDPKGTLTELKRVYFDNRLGADHMKRKALAADEWERPLRLSAANHKPDGSDIVIFAGVPFHDIGGGQRSAQLAKTFDRMGFRVHYFFAFPSGETHPVSLYNPCCTHILAEKVTLPYLEKRVVSPAFFLFETPSSVFLPFAEYATSRDIPLVYEQIDNWETSLGAHVFDAQTFRYLLKHASVLCATCKELVLQMQQYTDRPVQYLPNAADTMLFNPEAEYTLPRDFVKGEAGTWVYFGSLWGEWFDWELLNNTAKLCPDHIFLLIGDDSMLAERKQTLSRNIVFLGLKEQSSLPAYLRHADGCLLPFLLSDIGRYVSPLKIFEYLAMRKTVVATPLPDILEYPGTVCSDQASVWAETIRTDDPPVSSRAFSDSNSWFSRCDALLRLTDTSLTDPSAFYGRISVIILNHNNAGIIDRCVEALLSHNTRYSYEVIVVDNASTDGSPAHLTEIFRDRIRILYNDRNGCSSGRNLGAESSVRDYLLFLDSDQFALSDYWLDAALSAYAAGNFGAIGWTAGWFVRGTVEGTIPDSYVHGGVDPALLYREDVTYLGSGGMFLKRSVFEESGGFDEAYDPTGFEDTDLSMVLADLGYTLAYCPYINVLHTPHQTTRPKSDTYKAIYSRNIEYFEKKWKERNPEVLMRHTINHKGVRL